jgi:hypothetical protein
MHHQKRGAMIHVLRVGHLPERAKQGEPPQKGGPPFNLKKNCQGIPGSFATLRRSFKLNHSDCA